MNRAFEKDCSKRRRKVNLGLVEPLPNFWVPDPGAAEPAQGGICSSTGNQSSGHVGSMPLLLYIGLATGRSFSMLKVERLQGVGSLPHGLA